MDIGNQSITGLEDELFTRIIVLRADAHWPYMVITLRRDEWDTLSEFCNSRYTCGHSIAFYVDDICSVCAHLQRDTDGNPIPRHHGDPPEAHRKPPYSRRGRNSNG